MKILAKAEISATEDMLEIPPNPKFGDFAYPCFGTAKEQQMPPNEVEQEIAENSLCALSSGSRFSEFASRPYEHSLRANINGIKPPSNLSVNTEELQNSTPSLGVVTLSDYFSELEKRLLMKRNKEERITPPTKKPTPTAP